MGKIYRSFLIVFLAVGIVSFFITVSLAAKQKKDIYIKQSSVSKEEGYTLLELKYRSKLKKEQDIEIRFYALLSRKTREHTVVRGVYQVSGVEKGIHTETGTLTPSDIRNYGGVKIYRLEIWQDNVLIDYKNSGKQTAKYGKWWEEEKVLDIIKVGFDIKKLIKDLTR